ncbi:uncharacterized protein LOC122564604 [Chiloscyllium plagiosum]|uniref:uncharacterized protein LOC122564604 n=1 Tax=Chiloscyllium plagiosum TaxID=36176 RepID=UPI001CB82FC1|nr:uncharacterized protein LOC122564604 [Chiloscyllium plagiosum]
MATIREALKNVDETLCEDALCPHPLCWETLRRLQRGLPRKRLESIHKVPPETEDELPSLSLLALPQWSADRMFGALDLPITSATTSVSCQSHEAARPGSPQTMMGYNLEDRCTNKLMGHPSLGSPNSGLIAEATNVAELKQPPSSCDQYLGKTVFIWVPNPSYDRRRQKKRTQSITSARQVTVQELRFQGQPHDEQKQSQKTKKKAKDYVPTGGQPYTFLARQQQLLKEWKDTTKGKKHLLELAGPNQSVDESQDSRKLSAQVVPSLINKKFALRSLTEKQQQVPPTTRCKMDGKFLIGKRMNIIQMEILKHHKYLDKNLFTSHKAVTGSECRPTPISSMEGEWMEQYPELFQRDLRNISTHYSNLGDNRQCTDVIPEMIIEMQGSLSTAVDNQITAETDVERKFPSSKLTKPGDEVQIAKQIDEQPLCSTTEMGSPIVEQKGSTVAERNHQVVSSMTTDMESPTVENKPSETSLSVAERNSQDFPSTTTDMGSPTVGQILSDTSRSVAEGRYQNTPSTTSEMGSPTVGQILSDTSRSVAEGRYQNTPSTTSEMGSPTVGQILSDTSHLVAEESSQGTPSTITEMGSPTVGQILSDTSCSVAEGCYQDTPSTTTEMGSPAVEQIPSGTSHLVAEGSYQGTPSTTTDMRLPTIEQIPSDTSHLVAEGSYQGTPSTTTEMGSPTMGQILSENSLLFAEGSYQGIPRTPEMGLSIMGLKLFESSLSVAEGSYQGIPRTPEMGSSIMGLKLLESSLSITERSYQNTPSTATEMGSPTVGQILFENSHSVAEGSYQGTPSPTTEMGPPIVGQLLSENSLSFVEGSYQGTPSTITEMGSSVVGQKLLNSSLSVAEGSYQGIPSTITEMGSLTAEQIQSGDEISQVTGRNGKEDLSIASENNVLNLDHQNSKRSEDRQNSTDITTRVEQDSAAPSEGISSHVAEMDLRGAEI